MTPLTPGQRMAADVEQQIAEALAEAKRLNTDPTIRPEDWRTVEGDFAAVMGDFRRACETEHGGVRRDGTAWSCGPGGYREHPPIIPAQQPRRPWWRRLLWWRKAAGPAR